MMHNYRETYGSSAKQLKEHFERLEQKFNPSLNSKGGTGHKMNKNKRAKAKKNRKK